MKYTKEARLIIESTLHNNEPQHDPQAPSATDEVRGGGASSQAPRPVLRGAKCHELTEIAIDWARMSGPRSQVWEAIRVLEKRFGPTQQGKGRFFLNTGNQWAEGGVFYDMDKTFNARHCVVELPGKLIGELEHDEVRQVMYDLATMGFKTTRIDIAVDFYDRPNLIETVTESCHRAELCRSKTYQHIQQRSGTALTGHGINIGQRGKKGSGRYLRIYDKGLETGTLGPGSWVRWEVELADDCAQQFALKYITQDDSLSCCISHALWVVEFRQANGKRLSRRPLAPWYQEITESVKRESVRAVRAKSTVETYTRWIRTSVVPKLKTIAAATGHSVGGVMEHISGKVEPKIEHLQCPKVRTVSISMGADPMHMEQKVRIEISGGSHG